VVVERPKEECGRNECGRDQVEVVINTSLLRDMSLSILTKKKQTR
jgi:hypothetical protein